MDEFASLIFRNPSQLAEGIGQRLRWWRLSRGLTQQDLAARAGIGLSTLKSLETRGKATLLTLCRAAGVLGVDSELNSLFAGPEKMESIAAVKRGNRRRAPRKPKRQP